jgi:hypothetical protein
MKHTLIRTIPETPALSRRTTLRWMAAVMTASAATTACGGPPQLAWPVPEPVDAPGYGRDPNLLEPGVPWPLTLTREELFVLTALVDLILPAEGEASSASAVGVPAFLDEWLSAPYPTQRRDRDLILPGLAWLDTESLSRNGRRFAHALPADQQAIANDIAYSGHVKEGLWKPAEFFARIRFLTLGGYFTSPEGWRELGYIGNLPKSGDYPGPTPEAMTHLAGVLASMGLSLPDERY